MRLCVNTVGVANNGNNVTVESAEKLAEALEKPLNELFDIKTEKIPYSSKTVSRTCKLAGEILEEAFKKNLISENPYKRITPPKFKKRQPNFYSEDDVVKILKVARTLDIKHRLWVELTAILGCRRGEIAGIKWNRVDFDNRRILIDLEVVYTAEYGLRISEPKTEAGVRFVMLTKSAAEALKKYYREYVQTLCIDEEEWNRDDFIFFQADKLPEIVPMNPTTLTKYFSQLSKKHGLPHLNPHALRHSYASVLIQSRELSDLEIAEALGHSSAQITKEIYGHLFKSASAAAANVISNAYGEDD
ncbi:MAG: site-specific integrase [Lachnospiraceae bacterium]|nr:site-specific integrase [Lachnospiraceae bacterium]